VHRGFFASRTTAALTGDARGFSLIELLVSTAVLLLICGAATGAFKQLTSSQQTIWNRTEMHSGIRGMTELLEQEIGQAGSVPLPAGDAFTGAVAIGAGTVGLTSVTNIFVGEQLTIDAGPNAETVTVTAVNIIAKTISATFTLAHGVGAAVNVYGGFATGIVPDSLANGSTPTKLKLYGDVNGDGNLTYIEYTCDTVAGLLYRNAMPWNTVGKPAVTASQILVANILPNPGGTPCFAYQEQTVGLNTYVTDVAVTLTVQTQQADSVTQQFQTETKALLNVSPRNVFNTWQMASGGLANRIQPMPPSITLLLP
jgi:prepilin-type N-terminal cleavage/methylation domain-containing protein